MREPYIEGVATHDGPESCVVVREGSGEALTGVRAGRVIEPRNQRSGVPTPLVDWKATPLVALDASHWWAPRGRRTRACTEPSCARTGRSHLSPAGLITGGSLGERRWRYA